jgi:hypothetical protein
MAGVFLFGMCITGIPHILPALFELLIGCFGFTMYFIEKGLTLVGFELSL